MLEAAGDGNDLASLIIAGKVPILRIPERHEKKLESSDAISGHVLAYYYAALTNLFCQAYLRSTQSEDSDDLIRPIIDASYADFRMLESWFGECNSDEICADPNANLYQHIRDTWKEQIKDWKMLSNDQFHYGSSGTDTWTA